MFRHFILPALFALGALPGWAAATDTAAANGECAITIEGNDALQFNLKTIEVPKTCDDFTVNLKHVGKMPVNAMGHNWVLTKASDMQGAATDGMAAGLDNEYLKPNDDRIIAHTDLIGGGEETSVTFDVSELSADEKYGFFCSFPGHWQLMQGTLSVTG